MDPPSVTSIIEPQVSPPGIDAGGSGGTTMLSGGCVSRGPACVKMQMVICDVVGRPHTFVRFIISH